MVHRLLMVVGQVRKYHVVTFIVGKLVIIAGIIGLIANNYYYHVGENVLITQVWEFVHLQTEEHTGLVVDSCFVYFSFSQRFLCLTQS